MDLKNIKLTFDSLSNGGLAIVKEVVPLNPYKDGQRVTEEIIGRKVTVVFPENHYDTLTVNVYDPVDQLSALLDKATAATPVCVAFDGFEAGFHNSRNREGLWVPTLYAKATSVQVLRDAFDSIVEIE